jgi:hypothetical protein
LSPGGSIVNKTIQYEQDNSIFRTVYIAKIEASILERDIRDNQIVFYIQ